MMYTTIVHFNTGNVRVYLLLIIQHFLCSIYEQWRQKNYTIRMNFVWGMSKNYNLNSEFRKKFELKNWCVWKADFFLAFLGCNVLLDLVRFLYTNLRYSLNLNIFFVSLQKFSLFLVIHSRTFLFQIERWFFFSMI